jgi:peptidyl-prolyl cis-trans isomerase B (cyclophilin B)
VIISNSSALKRAKIFFRKNKIFYFRRRVMKKLISILLVTLLSVFTFSACGKDTSDSSTSNSTTSAVTTKSEVTFTATNHIEINVKDYGTISVALDANIAPITVANFLELANSGFYDGLTFHRIMTGFMIQGGNPLANGTGESAKNIKGEFSQNGVNNPLSHTRGAISMARVGGLNDSANSQFFIVQQDSTFLDGQYAAFGYVTGGMDIVDKICADTPVQDNNGTVLPADQPVIESVKVID